MIRIVGLKLLHLVPVLFLVSLATFLMIDLIPGDPALAIAGPDATPEMVEQIRAELDLDRPILVRYADWLGDAITGDLGHSLLPPVQPVSDMIMSRLPVTLEIAILAMAMSLVVSVPLALRSAHRPGDRFDRLASAWAFGSISIPSFLGALLLIFFFVFHSGFVKTAILAVLAVGMVSLAFRTKRTAQHYPPSRDRTRYLVSRGVLAAGGLGAAALVFWAFPAFPRQGFVRLTSGEGVLENLRHAFLPALTLAVIEGAIFMRLLRSDLLETLGEDYILSARARGLPAWRILLFDALRPSSFSVITVAGVAFGRAIGGTVIVETIFNLPGMGRLVVDAISARDYLVVQACVLVIAVFYVVINALVDVSYAYLDPRVRRGND